MLHKVPTKMRRISRAIDDFRCEYDGEPLAVAAGSRFDSDHPVVLANPEMFETVPVRYEIEQATAAPGERRER